MEVNINNINSEFRIDSEYFKKEILTYEKNLINYDYLSDLGTFRIGPFGSTVTKDKYTDKSDIFYIRGLDIGNFFLKEPEAKIDSTLYSKLPQYQVRFEDIFITVVGTLGKVSIITDKNIKALFSCKSTIFRTNINPYYLTTFLNTDIGYKLLLRGKRGAVQEGLNLPDLKGIKVPRISDEFQLKIEKLVKLAHTKLEQSKALYKQAENLLLKELDLLDFEPTSEKVAIKTFSESFGESGRLDSEYYQPKYDEIVEKIKSYRGGHEKLSNILISINTGEYSEEYYIKTEKLSFYIRSTNINNGLVQKDEKHYVDKNNFTKFVKEGDIVTARVGTLGVFGTIDKNLNDSIYSDNVLCFRLPDTLNPYVYTLFLNSKYNKLLIDRLSRGSVQQRLNQETLKDLFIPIIDNTIQIKIEEKIKESFKLKEESKALLDLAKRVVEVAIEEGEDLAMEFIDTEI